LQNSQKPDKLAFILTDTDGLYTGHPDDKDTELIKNVSVAQNVEQLYKKPLIRGGRSRGGWAPNNILPSRHGSKNIRPTLPMVRNRVILDIIEGRA